MAQYFEDFESYTPNATPVGWTKKRDGGVTTWTVFDTGTSKIVRGTNTVASPSTLTWDTIDADANRANMEVVIRFRLTDGSGGGGAVVRATTDTQIGYQGIFFVPALTVTRIQYGVSTNKSQGNFGWNSNTWYRLRIQVNGNVLKLRAWDEGSSEPTTWTLGDAGTVTDNNITTGGAGFCVTKTAGSVEFDWIGVGTNGSAAPAAPLGTHGAVALATSSTVTLAGTRKVHGASALSTTSTLSFAPTHSSHAQASILTFSTLSARAVSAFHAASSITTSSASSAASTHSVHGSLQLSLSASLGLYATRGVKGSVFLAPSSDVSASATTGRDPNSPAFVADGSAEISAGGTRGLLAALATSSTSTSTAKGTRGLHAALLLSTSGATSTASGRSTQHGAVVLSTASFSVGSPKRDKWADFLEDLTARRLYLWEIYPWDRVGQSTVSRYYSERGFVTNPGDYILSGDTLVPFEHVTYEGQVKTNSYFKKSMWSAGDAGPTIGGRSIPDYGFLELSNEDGSLDEYRNFSLDGRGLSCRLGGGDFGFNDFHVILKCTASSMELNEASLTINLRSLDYKLDKLLQPNVFGGRGNALKLDGANGYATLGSWSNTPNVGFELWLTVPGNNAAGTPQVVAWNGNAFSPGNLDWYIQVLTNGNVVAVAHRYNSVNPAAIVSFTGDIRDNKPHHIAISISGTTFKFWLDGQLVNSATASSYTAGTGNITIGSISGANNLNGTVDEVRFWSTSLTDSLVRNRRKYEIGNTENGLRGYWRMNSTTGTVVTDTGLSGTNGVLVGTGQTWVPTYTGTRDIGGQPIPLGWGPVENATPVLIDVNSRTYQFNDGPSQAVIAVYDAGVPLVLTTNYTVDLVNSRIVLVTNPSDLQKITVTFQGSNSSGYLTTTADIVKSIITVQGGLASWEINQASFDKLNVDAPQTINYYYDADKNLLDVLDELFDGIGGFYTINRSGEFVVGKFGPPTNAPKASFVEKEILSVERLPIVIPVWRYRVSGEPNWTVQTDGLAGGVDAARRAFVAESERIEPAENTAVLTDHLLATDPPPVKGFFSVRADTRFEAQRRLSLFGAERNMYRVTVKVRPFGLELNDTVSISYGRYGLDNGWNGVIIGLEEHADNSVCIMDLWG